ncbi:gasdermin-C2-like [Cricetulus griseus]|uniref:Gasdermin-C2-like n=1 Tax=Cricetulus griseus TaxID=10029 RepID=A0A9J7H938_CRIGR|nr:gasdermin-C2-like [Cricetulus griseus]
MSSSFSWVCKDVAEELDDLCPVKSLSKANKFRLFAILQRTSHPWFWKSEDIPVGYSLLDILEPNFPVPEPEVSPPMPFRLSGSKKLKGGLGVNAIEEGSVSAGIGDSRECNIEIRCTSIPEPKLEILQNRKLVDKEPSFMRYCRVENKDLYVVTEAYEVTKDTMVKDRSSVNLKGKLLLSLIGKFQAQGQGQMNKKCSVPIPKGAVVAYTKKKLVIENDTCDILLSANAKKKTFQGMSPRSLSVSVARAAHARSERRDTEFQHLQNEISEITRKLARLSKDVQEVVFCSLLPMLRDREILYDLMIMLELGELGHMHGPGGVILHELRKDSQTGLKDLILYLLHALMVLSDTQLNLLAQSMEKRLLLQQQELVKSILQQNFKYPWNIPFTLQPELLAPLQGEGLAITYELLKECGLKMELDNPRSTWDLEAKMPMAALYGSLSFLQQLVEPKSSSEPGPSQPVLSPGYI